MTVPEPVPVMVPVRVYWSLWKVAVTDLLAVMVTIQVPVPEQAPDQPAKVEPASGLAVKTTEVPELYVSE